MSDLSADRQIGLRQAKYLELTGPCKGYVRFEVAGEKSAMKIEAWVKLPLFHHADMALMKDHKVREYIKTKLHSH